MGLAVPAGLPLGVLLGLNDGSLSALWCVVRAYCYLPDSAASNRLRPDVGQTHCARIKPVHPAARRWSRSMSVPSSGDDG